MKITSDKRTGKAARMTIFDNGFSVETWYDRQSQAFVTQIKDPNKNVLDTDDLHMPGDSDYAGTVAWAKLNHEAGIELLNLMIGRLPG